MENIFYYLFCFLIKLNYLEIVAEVGKLPILLQSTFCEISCYECCHTVGIRYCSCEAAIKYGEM